MSQLVTRSTVIAVFLCLWGSVILQGAGVIAQETHEPDTPVVETEAAGPAETGYLFFPRSAAADSAAEISTQDSPESFSQADTGLDLDDQAWNATEKFSKRHFLDIVPAQYPLDNSAYEGEAPTGDQQLGPEQGDGRWKDSSVQRPAPEVSMEDQPWVEWYKITFQAQTLPTGDKGLGVTSLDLKGTLKFARWPFLFVTPRAGWHFLDGPPTTDLPPRLFDFSLDTTVYLPLNDRWTVQASVAPGIYTDGKATRDSFRMSGRGLVFYRWSQQLQLAGGFVYLGRQDVTALPAVGVVYQPTDDLKLDIIMPKPRIGYRYHHDLERERWVYMTGEFGGGTWAVRRVSGADDVATYGDLQLLLGIEHKEPGALNWQLEGGYVFSRKVEYVSGIGDTNLPGTAVLRMVLSF